MLAYIGSYKAIAEMKNMKLRGWISWFVWRSAYLTKLVSIKNKILVPFDWLKAIIFGRDVTKF
jgi:NADH:ubiquinone reductase (non-electrogenic)